MTAKIDISPEQLAIVQGILKDHLPKGTLAWAFGSRVTWTAKPFSDLDIALEGTAPLAPDVLIDLEEAFEASDLPWKVDVIDLNAVSPEFRAIVERQRVPADWGEAPLASLLSKVIDNRGRTCPVFDTGFPLIATNCVKDTNLYPVFEKVRFVDQATYDTWFRGHPKPGDLIFVLKGSPGSVCLTPDPVPFCIAQDMVALRADPKRVYPPYLFAALRSDSTKRAILNMHVGTMIPHFKKGDFDKLKIPLPNEASQRAIGDWYLILSKKIELNRRMNETLEAMARAVFRDWFVDFGPTRRKAAGTTDPAAILGHLLPDPTQAPPLANLFPDSFGANGLPEGWEEREVGELCPIVGGGTPSTKEPAFWDGGTHNWATPKDLSRLSGLFLRATERQVTDAGLAKVSSGLSPVGSVLLSSRAPIGYVAIAEEPVAVNQGFIVMQPAPAFPTEFAYFWTLENLDVIKANANGSTFQEISKKNFRPLRVNHAGDELTARFAEVAGPMMNLIRNNEQENQTLAATRDLLLPKLMSGEIRLTGAEGAA